MNITQFTTAQAQNRLQSDGLESLGLTALLLAPRWSANALPGFNAAALTLSVTQLASPFLGLLTWLPHGHDYTDAQGLPIDAACGVICLHPHAAQRLFRLASARYAPAVQLVHPLPVTMLLRLGGLPNETPRRIEAGDPVPAPLGTPLPAPVVVSFHDSRGLIICPVAVAAMFADLVSALPGLLYARATGATGDAGGLTPISALATGNLVQFADLHGNLYRKTLNTHFLNLVTPGAPATTNPVDHGTGYAMLAANQTIAADAGDGGKLRFGFATRGTLSRTPLALPVLPAALTAPPFATTAAPVLPRQFLRVVVVDPDWHLLGNRLETTRNAIPGDDANTPTDILPPVRDRIAISYAVDGVATLAQVDGVLARFAAAGSGMVMACSPAFAAVGLPPLPAPGTTVGWPGFPAAAGAPGAAVNVSPATGATAQWLPLPSLDVLFTIPAAATPKDAHVRIYTRRFIEIESIGNQPSFVRGDGGAALADGVSALHILLVNPLGLGAGDPHPAGAALDVDIVITPRMGTRRLWSGLRVTLTGGGTAVVNAFGGIDRLPLVPPSMQGWCAVPLFGLPRSVVPVGGGTLAAISRGLASESVPRTGPRLPLMARFETVVAAGIPDATATNGALSWQAVVTGARWMPESRSAAHQTGNPGNPAGPDVHAAGASVSGALAYDFAWHALRRAKPPIPFPGAPVLLDGWLVFGAGNTMNEPVTAATDAAPNAGTGMGAALQTVAGICENPELSLAPESAFASPTSVQDIVNFISNAINPGGTPPTINLVNGDRLLAQVRREFFVAKNGRRDALWSLRRALGEARELIYLEGAQFARTAVPAAPQKHALDLAQVIIDRMTAHKGLRVVIVLPRETDFAPSPPPMNFETFVQQALAARKNLVAAFPLALRSRLVVCHPVGFPGRYTAMRSSVIVVDDVYSLVGTSHFRRRGMTFDGAADLVSFDRVIDEGYSKKLRDFRRTLMATRLGIPVATGPLGASAEWVALEHPRSAFSVVRNLLEQGGLGDIKPLWDGNNPDVLPASLDVADPDGVDGATLLGSLASFLSKG
ncbi:hypothetical protein [Actimicrobium antarcticum]|uniref:PLD phosphodiesterase domain-containing protein n=1 Tax=Actimicrobium antarcticum TaxID=1051899 RepID=A0ABP7SKG6_9BURK